MMDSLDTHCAEHEPLPADDLSIEDWPRSAYVHVPFCRHRCAYCNFTLIANRDDLIPRYLRAVEAELGWLGPRREIDTLYFGGGTPSHLPLDDLRRLFAMTVAQFPLAAGYEWTIEANPRDVTADWCAAVVELGVTRVSLGAQSYAPRKLALLERDHDGPLIVEVVRRLLANGLRVAIDLIFGVPGESLDEWESDLDGALASGATHISTYGLTYERGAPFWGRKLRGVLTAIDEDLECSLYERCIDRLEAACFEHYEVSNFAVSGCRCRHNEACWLGGSYFGLGPGAASYRDGTRRMNHRGTLRYIQLMEQGRSPIVETETLCPEERARERLIFGLRRLEGVVRDAFHRDTGYSVDDLGGEALRSLFALRLLDDDQRSIRLTRRGLLISDSIWPHLLTRDDSP